MPETPDAQLLDAKLTQETAVIAWRELLPHFARGAVLAVNPALDLIAVAIAVSNDDAAAVRRWMDAGQFGRVSDAQAQTWLDADAALWALVVAPWVLVQERG